MTNTILNSVYWNNYTISIEHTKFNCRAIRDCWVVAITPDDIEDETEYYIEHNLIHAVEMYLTVLDEFIW